MVGCVSLPSKINLSSESTLVQSGVISKAPKILLNPILLFAYPWTTYAFPSSVQTGHGSINPFASLKQVIGLHSPYGSSAYVTKIPSSGNPTKIQNFPS